MRKLTTLFHDRRDAEDAIAWLRAHGYDEKEIGIVMHDPEHTSPRFGRSEEQSLGEALPMMGASAGVSVLAAAAGVMLVAGPAGLLAAGPLALLLGAVGAVTGGGITGALIGAGIPRGEAERYADELKQGGVLVSVVPHAENEQAAQEIFARLARQGQRHADNTKPA